MKDLTEQGDEQHLDLNSSISLCFPTIPLHGPPTDWRLRSQTVNGQTMMASVHDDSSCDDTTSSLGDSAYDFIDDRSVALTDESEERDRLTESITSSDGYEVERPNLEFPAPIPAAVDHNDTDDPSNLKTPTHADVQENDNNVQETVASGHALTAPPSDAIVFEEPSVINIRSEIAMDATCLLEVLSGQDMANLMPSGTPPSEAGGFLSVRQSMARHNFHPRQKAFKVLYDGPPQLKESIIQKIGSALAATSHPFSENAQNERASKFNIVPIASFGDSQNNEVVLIDSSGLELIVEDCVSCTGVKAPDRSSEVRMELSHSPGVVTSRCKCPGFVLSGPWELPDLAIRVLSGDGNNRPDFAFETFMLRHGIKTLIMYDTVRKPLLDHGRSSDWQLPHFLVDYRIKDKFNNMPQRKTLPIDLPTFLRIDAGQLNRSLALCVKPKEENAFDTACEVIKNHRMVKMATSILKKASGETALLAVLLGLVFSLILTAILAVASSHENFASPTLAQVVSTSTATHFTTTTTYLTQTSVPATKGLVASGNLQVSNPNGLSPITDIASLLLDANSSTSNKSDQFKIHVLGDCHIILRPPQWLVKAKKSPVLSFKISRGDSVLEHTTTTLFDGVYALQIPREEAYGLLNVRIRKGSKPLLDEKLEVDFGSSWLKIAAWKRASRAISTAMQHDLSLFQSSLSIVYNQTKAELSTFVRSTKENVSNAKADRNKTSPSLGAIVISQTKDLSRIVSKKFHSGQKETSKLILALSKDVSKDFQEMRRDLATISKELRAATTDIKESIFMPMRARYRRVVKQAEGLAHGAPSRLLERANGGVGTVQQYYRNYQKEALKAWWRIAGIPRKDMKQTKAPRGRGRRMGSSKG